MAISLGVYPIFRQTHMSIHLLHGFVKHVSWNMLEKCNMFFVMWGRRSVASFVIAHWHRDVYLSVTISFESGNFEGVCHKSAHIFHQTFYWSACIHENVSANDAVKTRSPPVDVGCTRWKCTQTLLSSNTHGSRPHLPEKQTSNNISGFSVSPHERKLKKKLSHISVHGMPWPNGPSDPSHSGRPRPPS